MKRIIINGRFLTQRITGVQRYATEIVRELDRLVGLEEIELAVPPETREIPPYQNIRVIKVGHLHDKLWEHISFPLYVKKKKAIALNLCNVAPLSSPGIVCIHDMKIKTVPQFFSRRFRLWYRILFWNAVKRGKAIITVSNFSKDEICRYYDLKEERVYVIPDAWQHYMEISYDKNALQKYNVEKGHYLFSMSSLEPNKNLRWIAEAAKKNPSYVFAVAGGIDKAVFANGIGFTPPENMKLLGYVSDAEAKTLMRNCKAFLFPTFYEGFGLPPLEAISVGAENVVVSDTKIMHEIFDNSVLYIDNSDANIDFNILFRDMTEGRRDVLNRFSWKQSARLLLDVLKSQI